MTGLQQDQKLAQVPLIVIGDRDSPPFQAQTLEAAAYLNWPFSQSALLEAIFHFLGTSVIEPDDTHSIPPGGGRRILVAEDMPANQEVIIALLEKRGDTATIVNNGREAVEAIQSAFFDLVLMDMQMPEMGGVEATQMIRGIEARKGRHTPIVALTAHAMKGDRERYLASGMDGYLSKPIRPEELFREIDKWTSAGELHV